MFYCRQRGIDEEEAVALIVNGFAKEVLQSTADGICDGGAAVSGPFSLEGSVG